MDEKYVMITGSSNGLGAELAKKFSSKGYSIILHGRDKKRIEILQKKIINKKVNCISVVGDIKKLNTIKSLSSLAKKKNIQIFINNAAIMSLSNVEKLTDSEIDKVITTNLTSQIKIIQRIYSLFLTKKEGTIISINSSAGLQTAPKHALYCATKFGLRGFTECLRAEAKPNNIRIIDIYPAGIKTTFFNRVGGRKNLDKTILPKELAKYIWKMIDADSLNIDKLILSRMHA